MNEMDAEEAYEAMLRQERELLEQNQPTSNTEGVASSQVTSQQEPHSSQRDTTSTSSTSAASQQPATPGVSTNNSLVKYFKKFQLYDYYQIALF